MVSFSPKVESNSKLIIFNFPIVFSYPVLASKKGRYSYKKRYEYVLKSEQQKDDTIQEIPPHPVSVVDEAVILGSRISDLFSSCISYPVNFYDELSGYRNVSMVNNFY